MQYRTIKALVFEHIHRHRGVVEYDALTSEVLYNFPESKWNPSHWTWYRYQICKGRFKDLFSETERQNLRHGKPVKITARPVAGVLPARHGEQVKIRRSPKPKDSKVKAIGDVILKQARASIRAAAGDDADLRFKLNRWVFSRLTQDEMRIKRPIKQMLWKSGMRACQACKQPFDSPRGLEVHRNDASAGYSVENCELLCRDCHIELSK